MTSRGKKIEALKDYVFGNVSDNPVDPLPPVYNWAKIKLIEFQYRKLFHLSYNEIQDEPFEEIKVALEIQRFIKAREKIMRKQHGN